MRPDADEFDHFGPFCGFLSDQLDEIRRRAAEQVQRRTAGKTSLHRRHGINRTWGGDPFLREFERAREKGQPQGCLDHVKPARNYRDPEEAMASFQLATELEVAVVIHPPSVGFDEERMREDRLTSALADGICEMIGRMDYAYRLQEEASFLGPHEPMLIRHPQSHYLNVMDLESTCYHRPAARCAGGPGPPAGARARIALRCCDPARLATATDRDLRATSNAYL